jgi:hypothetical protein
MVVQRRRRRAAPDGGEHKLPSGENMGGNREERIKREGRKEG